LFAKAKTPATVTLAQVWNNGNIKVSLHRGASLLLHQEKAQVISVLTSLADNFLGPDMAVWFLEPKGLFTVKSLYIFFMNSGMINTMLLVLWDLKNTT
jgi:hypothetical protein